MRKLKKNNKGSSQVTIFFIVALSVIVSACVPEKNLHQGQYLLVKNSVSVDKRIPIADDLVYAVRPRTNKRTFGIFLWKVGLYQAAEVGNTHPKYEKFRRKMRNTVGKSQIVLDTLTNDYYRQKIKDIKYWVQDNFGEAPVLYDSAMVVYSIAQLKLMMFNNGYFNAEVVPKASFNGQRAKVRYSITAGEPYRINEISYQIADEKIAAILMSDTGRCVFKKNDIYTVEALEKEQARIATRLNNRGYFYFSKNFIRFQIDTNLNNMKMNVKMLVENPKYRINDSVLVEGHHRYYTIDDIYINTLSDNESRASDTLLFAFRSRKSTDSNYYNFLFDKKIDYRPKTLISSIFFSNNDRYTNWRTDATYEALAMMKNFDYIKVSYLETPESKAAYLSDTGKLDCKIDLLKSKRNNLDFEILYKNTGSRFGFGGSLTLLNRNTFKGGEILSFTVKYTQELQNDSGVVYFKNFEFGGVLSLEIPRFLFPIRQHYVNKSFRPKTIVQLGGNFVRQDLYDRFISDISFSYRFGKRFTKNRAVRIDHNVSVLDFNLVKMYPDDDFNRIIQQYRFSQRILEKYKDHFILGSSYLLTLQNSARFVFRAKFDWYGNLLYGIFAAGGKRSDKYKNEYDQYTIWKIPFSSGFLSDLDFVYNIVKRKKQDLVFHINLGVGVPILNSTSLPFEKSLYLGGSNSMRGWRIRTLGPGGYVDTAATDGLIERTGDIKLELNLEYRFKIYKVINAAVFADAGNIWLSKKNADFPKAEFAINRFYSEIALSAGVGIRLDLSFFVLRLDYSIKLHNPAMPANTAWQRFNWSSYQDYTYDRSVVLGIGYPF